MSQSQQTVTQRPKRAKSDKRPHLEMQKGEVMTESQTSTCSEEGDSPFPDYSLPYHILQEVVLKLSELRDVLRCLRVCKTWSRILQATSFWKRYLHTHHDLTPAPDPTVDEVLWNWQGDQIYIYFDDIEQGDPRSYVFKPFPVLLKCGVVVGSGVELSSGTNVENYNSLTIAVDKLLALKKKCLQFECTVAAFANESDGPYAVWLMPWNQNVLPTGKQVMAYFNVNPKIAESVHVSSKAALSKGQLRGSFTMYAEDEEDDDDDEDVEFDDENGGDTEDIEQNEENPSVDDEPGPEEEEEEEEPPVEDEEEEEEEEEEGNEDGAEEDDEEKDDENGDDDDDGKDEGDDQENTTKKEKPTLEEREAFKSWLHLIFQPSHVFSAGENLFNPTLYLHMTRLSPDYVGGILSTVVMT